MGIASASLLQGRATPPAAGRVAVHAAAIVAALGAVLVAAAPLLAPHDPYQVDFAHRLQPSSWSYPLGTDAFGRCLLSRLIHGFQVTPVAALAVVAVSAGLGTVLGMASGLVGGLPDRILMRVVEGVQVLPALALALIVGGVLGLGLWTVVLTLAAIHWTEYARLVRNLTMAERVRPYVRAAEALGARRRRVLASHILPNIAPAVLVMAAYSLSWAILSFAGLGFLGLGAEPGTPEWGLMIAESRSHLRAYPRLVIVPGLAIAATVIAVNILGDALADRRAGAGRPFASLLTRTKGELG